MNIQIFGTKKSADTRKAERFFKERGIKYQFIDLKEKSLSKGEFASVKQAVGGLDKLIDENSKDKDTLALIKYIADEDKEEKILENQQILVQPIVRNGKKATVGYQPDIWKSWDWVRFKKFFKKVVDIHIVIVYYTAWEKCLSLYLVCRIEDWALFF